MMTRPRLKLVPNLTEMERVLRESAEQMAPMVSRSKSVQQKFDAEIKVLNGERDGITARMKLAERHFNALISGFKADIADVDRAIGFYSAGLSWDLEAAELRKVAE